METPEGGFLQALVPIYGTKDAGRGLWRRVYRVCVTAGLVENFCFPALYHYAEDSKTKIMLATHVDDIIWAVAPGYEHIVTKITSELLLGNSNAATFTSAVGISGRTKVRKNAHRRVRPPRIR